MILYHYALKKYDYLKTHRMLNKESKNNGITDEYIAEKDNEAKKYAEPFSYADHVSFFFTQMDIERLINIHNNKHAFWRRGNIIFEHTVDTKNLEKNCKYHFVETKIRARLLENESKEFKSAQVPENYYTYLNDNDLKLGNIGTGITNLEKRAIKLLPEVNEGLERYEKEPWLTERYIKLYAAKIPHVKICILDKPLKVLSVKPIVTK